MRISLDWIKDFVTVEAPVDEIAHRLTMVGLEIEGIEHVDGDVIMEVNVTPNRPDCLSILGIAREVAAAFSVPLRIPDAAPEESGTSDVTVTIADPDLCSRYAGRSVFGVTVGESPEWMKKRLEKCGIRAINNVVDVTNYVLLEFGHPLHAFDADLIAGKAIRVARAGEGRRMRTLDGADRELPSETLLIWDKQQPVAIAGVMGGEGSSVTEKTRDVFLESAHFTPSSIRKSSKALGLRSESSYRFERGTDVEFLATALNRAASLVRELAGGSIGSFVDEYPVRYTGREITVSYRKVNALLGTDLAPGAIRELLGRIGIQTDDRGEVFSAYPPAFRGDVTVAVDVIEEVARCYGYDRIPVRRPRAVLSDGMLNQREHLIGIVRDSMRRSGFNEVINFSFMNSAELDLLSISVDKEEQRRKHLLLKNPLRQEECLMRTTLVSSLLRNFVANVSHGVRDVRIFECSRVFIDWGKTLPSEGLRLAGVWFQDPTPSLWKDAVPSFYQVKGSLEALFDELRLPDRSWNAPEEAFLHPGKSADILAGGQKVGYMGELNPEIAERLDLKMGKPQIVVFEIDLDAVFSARAGGARYRPLPKFPAIERDVALILDDAVTAEQVLAAFREYRSDIVEGIELFDAFKGKSLPPDKKSVGVRIVYRKDERTLSEAEVEPVHAALVAHALGKTGGTVRGAA